MAQKLLINITMIYRYVSWESFLLFPLPTVSLPPLWLHLHPPSILSAVWKNPVASNLTKKKTINSPKEGASVDSVTWFLAPSKAGGDWRGKKARLPTGGWHFMGNNGRISVKQPWWVLKTLGVWIGWVHVTVEINPEYSLERLMLKLKLQYFGHLMPRADSREKTLMLGRTEGKRRQRKQKDNRGWDG